MTQTKQSKQLTIIPVSYERRSSESEDRQVASLETQRRENAARAARDGVAVKPALQLQESHSAKHAGQRPIFEQLIRLIETGKANVLYVWGPHRISRNAIDAARIIDLMDRELLHEVRTPGQTFRNTPADKMMLTLLCTMAKLENDTKGENVKDGLRTKALAGDYPGPAPIGYRNVGEVKGKKKLVKDPARFPVIRRMWDLVLTGRYSPAQIWNIATNEWGLRTPERGRSGNKKLSRSNVYYLFNNPFYYGEFEWPRGSGDWHKGNHSAMISKAEFDRVQFLLGRKGNPRAKSQEFTYRGFMICANCGASITAERKHKRLSDDSVKTYVFYHCTHHKATPCSEKSIEETVLEAQILEQLAKFTMPDEVSQWCLQTLEEMEQVDSRELADVEEEQRKQIALCAKKLDGLMDMRATGEISETEYRTRKAAIFAEKEQLESSTTGTSDSEWITTAKRGFDFARAACIAFKQDDSLGLELRKEIMSTIGSNHELVGKKVTLKADILIEAIEKLAESASEILRVFEPKENGSNAGRNGAVVRPSSYLLPG